MEELIKKSTKEEKFLGTWNIKEIRTKNILKSWMVDGTCGLDRSLKFYLCCNLKICTILYECIFFYW